jgi:hypothetical protein
MQKRLVDGILVTTTVLLSGLLSLWLYQGLVNYKVF